MKKVEEEKEEDEEEEEEEEEEEKKEKEKEKEKEEDGYAKGKNLLKSTLPLISEEQLGFEKVSI